VAVDVAGDAAAAAKKVEGAVGAEGSMVFKTDHYATRLEAEGVNVAHAEAQVAEAVNAMQPSMTIGVSVQRRMVVDGVLVEYRAIKLPNGTINIGTIFPVKQP
jgi:filamentous hemagglutinin